MQSEQLEKIIARVRSKIMGGKVLSIQSSDKHTPHFAKILIQNFQKKQVAVVIGLQKETAENLLTYALLWFHELGKQKTKQADKLWIISDQFLKLAKLCAVLREDWRQRIRIFDLHLIEKYDEIAKIKKVKIAKPPKINPKAQEFIPLLPNEIQSNGKTLTFNGLPFIKFKGTEVWFGVEHQKQKWNAANNHELNELIENLRIYRRHDSPNKHHAFYKLLPEAWLESCLRADINLLDKNLILSPVHQQFRASSEQIDLLALRKDGRLVIIELKVAPNREHLFQAVDYWQEIEKQRIAGNLQGLFGDLPISGEPSLVYLVAPHSCFHKDFQILANAISKDIGIYRFDLNKNWREKIKVIEKRLLD